MEVNYYKIFFTQLSEYQIHLETTNKGRKFITISRFLADKNLNDPSEKIYINPDILNNLIDSLEDCRELLCIKDPGKKDPGKTDKFPLEIKKEIRHRYLKGVSIKDLCIQFNTIPIKIENILMEANIEIIDPKLSKPPKSYWRRRKKS